MDTFIHTDESQDVLISLNHCFESLRRVRESPGEWKWVILSLHSAVQGAMVCHLSGTAGVGALTSESAKRTLARHDEDLMNEIAQKQSGRIGSQYCQQHFERRKSDTPKEFIAAAQELFDRLDCTSERMETAG